MLANERTRFTLLIQAMASTFRAEVTPALLEGYWIGLDDLKLDDVRAAVRSGMRDCEFLPTVAKLRELARPRVIPSLVDQDERDHRCNYHGSGGKGPNPAGAVWFCRPCYRRPELGAGEPEPMGAIMARLPLPEPDRRLPRERDE
jgi:hypothetical protein